MVPPGAYGQLTDDLPPFLRQNTLRRDGIVLKETTELGERTPIGLPGIDMQWTLDSTITGRDWPLPVGFKGGTRVSGARAELGHQWVGIVARVDVDRCDCKGGVLDQSGSARLLVDGTPFSASAGDSSNSIVNTSTFSDVMLVFDIPADASNAVLQIGPPWALYGAPRNRFVAEFLGGMNVFKGRLSARPSADTAVVETEFGAPALAMTISSAIPLFVVGFLGLFRTLLMAIGGAHGVGAGGDWPAWLAPDFPIALYLTSESAFRLGSAVAQSEPMGSLPVVLAWTAWKQWCSR